MTILRAANGTMSHQGLLEGTREGPSNVFLRMSLKGRLDTWLVLLV